MKKENKITNVMIRDQATKLLELLMEYENEDGCDLAEDICIDIVKSIATSRQEALGIFESAKIILHQSDILDIIEEDLDKRKDDEMCDECKKKLEDENNGSGGRNLN